MKSAKKNLANLETRGPDLQQLDDQLFGVRSNPRRNVILVLLDPGVGVLQRLGLKRRLPDEQRVQDAADRPDVDFVAVALLAEDLRCDVVGSPAEGSLPFAVKVDLGGQTEVAEFDLKNHGAIYFNDRKQERPPATTSAPLHIIIVEDGFLQ